MDKTTEIHDIELFGDIISLTRNIYRATYDSELQQLYCSCDNPYYPLLLHSGKVLRRLRSEMGHDKPVLISNRVGLFWIADFSTGEDGSLKYIHLLGPMFIQNVPPKVIKNRIVQEGGTRISYSEQQLLSDFVLSLPVVSVTRLHEYAIMLHYCLRREHISIEGFEFLSETTEKRDRTRSPVEEAYALNAQASWKIENHLLTMVENGDVEALEASARLASSVNPASLGDGDHIRQLKNIAIIFTALCTRAAVRGGLPVELAYMISDKYIQNIERGRSLKEIAAQNMSMQREFVTRVHAVREQAELPPQIIRCCAILERDFRKKINLEEVARELWYSPTYLSRLFNKEMNMSITDYVTAIRIREAKKLLRASSESIQQLSYELGFSSPGYFIDKFKAATGMTPNEYRRTKA